MKAKDLRIGNLVDTPDGVEEIYSIEEDTFRAYLYKNTWAEIKPIPLTEEWLLKFGFSMGKHSWFYSLDWGDSVNSFKVAMSISGEGGVVLGINDFNCHVKHVHELQNLFYALTNKELEIT